MYKENQVKREKVVECLEGWMAYAKHGNTYKYRRELLRNFNRHFPIKHKNEIIKSKKARNFFRKVYSSKVEFSAQKTLLLVRKDLSIKEIAYTRFIKEGTVWTHLANLIECGQLSVWNIMPKIKIVYLLQKIQATSEPLKQIKERIKNKNISYDEINCVKAHLKMKEKIKMKSRHFMFSKSGTKILSL